MQHEDEKLCLKELSDGALDLLRETLAKECEAERKLLLEQTSVETAKEMETDCAEKIDAKLMQQSIEFEEQLQRTLKDIEAGNKQQIEVLKDSCLDAMDRQHNLLSCRQITETMHMMITNEKHWRTKMTDMKNEIANPAKDDLGNQSKSLKQLWIEFQRQLDGFDGGKLRGDEKELFDQIHQIGGELMIEQEPKACFIIHEPITTAVDDSMAEEFRTNTEHVDWIDKREKQSLWQIKREPYVSVKWKDGEIESPNVDSFTSSLFQRFLQPQCSMQRLPAVVASSIINLMRNSNDDKSLEENIAALIQDLMKGFAGDKSSADAKTLDPTSTGGVRIEDSLEVSTRHVP